MDLTTEQRDGVTIVSVNAARIDAAVAIQFKDRMRMLTEGQQARVILDLGQVDFIDSSGLGAIVASMKQMPEGQKLELAALGPNVDKVFRLTRMDTIFTIHENVGEGATSHAG